MPKCLASMAVWSRRTLSTRMNSPTAAGRRSSISSGRRRRTAPSRIESMPTARSNWKASR